VIRYRYQSQVQPPAPFVAITLLNPITGAEQVGVPAQIDTAADRSLLPETIVESLRLPRIGDLPVIGVGGVSVTMPTFPVRVQLHDLAPQMVEVVASPGEEWVLLGRDLINAFRIL
jgi:hypothetical protein